MEPQTVSREEWLKAREALLAKEKAHTRAGDALAPSGGGCPVSGSKRTIVSWMAKAVTGLRRFSKAAGN